MPYITFMWHPKSDEWLVGPIVDDLRAIADAHNVGFYVNAKEDEEKQPVVVSKKVTIPDETLERLKRLAVKAGVTIYVNPPEPLA